MTRTAVVVACTGVLSLGLPTDAAAEPITITGGSMVFAEPSQFQRGSISIFGTRGFSIVGGVDSGEGRVDPLACHPCEPLQPISVGAELGTFAIVGNATLDGKVYTNINTFSSDAFARLLLGGVTQLPPVQGASVVVSTPFTVLEHSVFQFPVGPEDSQELARVALRGSGTATLMFSANPFIPVWEISQVRYDFQPIPEPATMILVGGPLIGVLLGRTMRRRIRTGTDGRDPSAG